MLNFKHTICIALGACAVLLSAPSLTETQPAERGQVDLVIALDVSGSMTGLIDSAKQRLWDVVNELGRAEPTPELRIAILSYGNPSYGAATGYVRVNLPFTSDLDAVNQTLFSFGTNGGDEYVARVVDRAVNALQWSPRPDAMRILFVAGNESATQDPQISLDRAARLAAENGIVVNTIYCGNAGDGIALEWGRLATMTNGLFAGIDQNTAAVAAIATPMDEPLARLNEDLNKTYLAFGADGERQRANVFAQDRNAAEMSRQAVASRAVTKAGSLYDSSAWDLVDAVAAGLDLAEVDERDLPPELAEMDSDQRSAYVAGRAADRARIRKEIAALDAERRDYLSAQRAAAAGAPTGLDDAMREALRHLFAGKGITLGE